MILDLIGQLCGAPYEIVAQVQCAVQYETCKISGWDDCLIDLTNLDCSDD